MKFNQAVGSQPKTPPKCYERLESLRFKPTKDKEADVVEMKLPGSPLAERLREESSGAPPDDVEAGTTTTSAKDDPIRGHPVQQDHNFRLIS